MEPIVSTMIEDEIKVPDDIAPEKIPEGFTADEWEGMTNAERDSLAIDKGQVNAADEEAELGPKLEAEVDDEVLSEIAEEEPVKKDEEVVVPKVEAEAKPEVIPEIPEIVIEPSLVTDEELLSFRPRVDLGGFKAPSGEVITPEVVTALADIKTKFDAGDISADERDEQRAVLNRQIVLDTYEARDAAKANYLEAKAWEVEQSSFFAARPEYDLLKHKDNPGALERAEVLYGALNQAVIKLSKQPANAGKSGMAIMVLADKQVKRALGITTAPRKKAEAAPTGKKTAAEIAAAKPAAQVPDVKTLAEIPESMPNDTGNWMKALDRLRGEKLEAAMSRLTPDQRERYRTSAR